MSRLDSLYDTVFNYPAIDNHAHPLLKAEFRDKFPFELSVSEAEGEALTNGAIHTLACFRATAQLSSLFSLEKTATWEDVKARRRNMPYLDLCKYCMDPCKIQCLLLDDGLGGVAEYAGNISWHSEQFCETKRIVRIETEAEGVLKELLTTQVPANIVQQFKDKLKDRLTGCARDSRVVAFKSVVCYRTGLDVSTKEPADEEQSTFKYLQDTYIKYQKDGVVRLQHKPLNDIVVRLALEIAGSVNIPVQFHTGLGDNDLSLLYSSPAHLQPLIKAYPQTKIVLLHASYPYTKEAGYLTAVYSNVFLDFGEIFPAVSGPGQRAIIRQIVDLTPTNKILWSTDGHWFPETYYLGTIQARQALYDVLSDIVQSGELTELQAIKIVENALFHNSNELYNLGLVPNRSL
ncbi:developmental protein [Moniliophthora roreri MCA 2997]|uniref:Developmental protein n=1 Tax=Moniliophthora roreri (strain MCA 2997) TaxID=1381753 RepID=V2Y1Y7_MONRO|nr:developmental protein [Moniliophthora roreri MCA 2997]